MTLVAPLLLLTTTLPLFIARSLDAQTIQSPEVHPDRTVTFRLLMPLAQKAEVHVDDISGMTTITMTKDSSGVWSATTTALTPDIYAYQFAVDGQDILDPNVRAYVSNHFRQGGLLTVPGSPAAIWEQKEVPHGAVSRHFFSSKITGDQRDYYVYLPPEFDPRSRKTYPVLYLLHGYSDYTDGWIAMGRANFILDNLIAQGKAKPMIVVMPSGYSVPALLDKGWAAPQTPLWRLNVERFPDMLLEELIPLVEGGYPVQRDRNSRAIAGLSMGGGEAVYTGLNHIDRFAWIAPMSAAVPDDLAHAFPKLNANQGSKIRLLWIACGKQDFLYEENRNFKAWLTLQGIPFTSVETEGAHTWPVWRRNLADLLPVLFR
jgi:enterochelin esterase-like enzyme